MDSSASPPAGEPAQLLLERSWRQLAAFHEAFAGLLGVLSPPEAPGDPGPGEATAPGRNARINPRPVGRADVEAAVAALVRVGRALSETCEGMAAREDFLCIEAELIYRARQSTSRQPLDRDPGLPAFRPEHLHALRRRVQALDKQEAFLNDVIIREGREPLLRLRRQLAECEAVARQANIDLATPPLK
ncbi:hypothetical protein H696_04266 [Fonticula alba]|uniref:Uncharacterized protein n=1 Tax=Fonticula alba TaxID=691883 RepID=A0A058Z4J5_FONAL|nr:hypothetical protein H696_04266 [Fonticula alba]KCV68848.1 hypothetical protein H696_04266 [Fonticula alba]|eukprot:XP_009496419.1 hypothetical protein H696_04266 [Fonticula alba]